MRNVFAILLIIAAISIYYGYTKNVFADIKATKLQIAEYNDTLKKADQLEEERVTLTQTMNSFNQEDRSKLAKMIPDNADNVRLIIDIQNIAQGTGMVIKDIKINDENKQGTQTGTAAAQALSNGDSAQKYNFVTLSFTVVSNYDNYVLFLSKLEQSLRLMDITTLSVKNAGPAGLYNFDLTIKAYWLK